MRAKVVEGQEANSDLLALMRSVVQTESQALATLADSLDESLVAALSLLQGCRGRIIVTAIGKSGHIARKLAATLSSTGTPAYFVHAAEAGHGDLGMICGDDVVMALSNSGKSSELMAMVAYVRRHDIPLLAICGAGAAKTLFCQSATCAVVLPSVAEACPLNLAPTTSTTMMLALGDALALALLQWRDFSAEDFRRFHPGGGLGARLQTVEQLMHSGQAIPIVTANTIMQEALLVMTSKHFGCLGVINNKGDLIGIITDGDLRRHMATGVLDKTAETIMTKNPQTIDAQALAVSALRLMNRSKITSLFVVQGKQRKPCGILHIHDCLRAGIS
ncbi:MAG: KpsF/GutQ family sugar-phosphate isomerase [Alphaproteobacteria bacterium GM202ARS2]|nr:KpsF/GutQ family sugar-phosphate isomerase [Alphaproteobacteria bacterium GM202ARS2]